LAITWEPNFLGCKSFFETKGRGRRGGEGSKEHAMTKTLASIIRNVCKKNPLLREKEK